MESGLTMFLRNFTIAQRLTAGLFAILAIAAGLLAYSLLSASANRHAIGQAIQVANHRSERVQLMHQSLLRTAVMVRNMGLQTETDGVNAAEQAAVKARKAYLDHRKALEEGGVDDASQALLAQLLELDKQTEKHFADAVGLAQQFNTEQAAAIIAKKIDPLTARTSQLLDELAKLQDQLTVNAQLQAEASARRASLVVMSTGVLGLVLALWIGWSMSRSISGPLHQAVALARDVADGKLDTQVAVQGRDEPAQLLQALNQMAGQLAKVVSEVRSNSDGIATGSTQIANGNADLSHRTEQQASALQQTAASMEELGQTVRLNADNAREANGMAQGASSVAARGGEVVGQMVDTMRAISESSRRIADIIGTIDGIAFQTNILALNAAVEAARAGEQGRGFAVVATEVRNLAQRSAAAAREIKQLIGTSVERVEQGNALAGQAGATMGEIVGAIQRVSSIISEISTASAEQSSGVSQVGQAVTLMDQATQQNAALVEESAAAAASLQQQAERLMQAVSVFRLSGR
jgi:methyl-accepting chemotaxis protein